MDAKIAAPVRPRTMDFSHQGDRIPGAFTAAEMDRRRDGLRRIMAAGDIDCCLITSYHGVCYLTGFLYCRFGRNYAAVIDHDRATLVSAAIDAGQPWRRSDVDNVVYTDWRRDNFHRAVGDLIAGAGRVGIEFDDVSIELRQQLANAFPGVEWVDVGAAAARLRMIKSADEIAHIEKMAAIADKGGEAACEALVPGVREFEVADHAVAAMNRAIADAFPHLELMDTWCWFQSGLNTDGAHNALTTRTIKPGDILSLNCFPMVAGYYVALERTLFAGHASDAHLRYWQANLEVHRAGLELLRPGARCADIALALNELYAARGLLEYRTFGYGHSFGVLCHYYGREGELELREDVDTVLEPGMVVSMEPMITIPHGRPGAGGYREHDIVVITEHGGRNITGFPLGPERNIIPFA